MAKTSSSKKVARVARTGSSKRRVRERPKMAFPLAIFVIIVLGCLSVFYARTSRINSADAAEAPVANKDHWHIAYGTYVCDHFLPPVTDKDPTQDLNGIHTHGDGIIHTHPFNAASSGSNARLKIWADQVGMKFGNGSFTMPDGTEYKDGYDCNGKPAKVYVYRWEDAQDPAGTAEVFTNDLGKVKLNHDRAALTFAVVPEGTEVPHPDSINTLDNLTDVANGGNAAGGVAGAADPNAQNPTASVITTPADPTASQPVTSTPSEVPSTPAAPTPSVSTPASPAASTP